MAKDEFKCDVCGCTRYSDIEGWGKDDYGKYTDYWCEDCDSLVRIYYDEVEE